MTHVGNTTVQPESPCDSAGDCTSHYWTLWLPLLAAIPLAIRAVPALASEWMLLPDIAHVYVALPAGLFYLLHPGAGSTVPSSSPTRQHPAWIAAGGLFLAASLFLFYCDTRLGEPIVLGLGCWLAVLGGVLFCNGWAGLTRVYFGLLLLLFALPWPQLVMKTVLHIRLQRISSICASGILNAIGIQTDINGTTLYLGREVLNVAEQCSGLKFTLVLLVSALLIGRIMIPSNPFRRVFLVFAGILLAMTANVLRLATGGILMHHWGREAGEYALHGTSSLVIYILGIGGLCWLSSLLEDDSPDIDLSDRDAEQT